jgi:hypothetical protein
MPAIAIRGSSFLLPLLLQLAASSNNIIGRMNNIFFIVAYFDVI